jgi:hypothetical protein
MSGYEGQDFCLHGVKGDAVVRFVRIIKIPAL